MNKSKVGNKKKRKYTDETLKLALEAIRSGRSTSEVARSSQVPKSTLIAVRNGQRPGTHKFGPATVLTAEEENTIVMWIKYLNIRGFPVTKNFLMMNVSSLIKKLGRPIPFNNGIPGKSWYQGFRRRHPEIADRVAQNLTQSRTAVTEVSLRDWFEEVGKHLENTGLMDIDGSRVFNGDESGFFLAPKGERVLVPRGDKAVYTHVFNSDRECLTVLFMVSARGDLPPPMVIFPYERMPGSISAAFPIEWSIGQTAQGWMTSESFYDYIKNVFDVWLEKNNVQRPVVLYVDGHSSHITLPTVEFCMEHQIELIALRPNATHILQPCDKALFGELKKKYREKLNLWRCQHQRKLRREEFGPLLKTAVDALDLPKLMSNGFRGCGLYPFDPNALSYNDLLRKQRGDIEGDAAVSWDCSKNIRNPVLEALESRINPELLQSFRDVNKHYGTWTRDEENKGLFRVWQGIANDENSCPRNSTLEEVVSLERQDGDLAHGEGIESFAIEGEIVTNVIIEEVDMLDMDTGIVLDTGSADNNGNFPIAPNRDVPDNIPEVYKSALFWPNTREASTNKRKSCKTVVAATTDHWRRMEEEKIAAKAKKVEEAAERSKRRKEIAERKKKEKEEKDALRMIRRETILKKKAIHAEEMAKKKAERQKIKSLEAEKAKRKKAGKEEIKKSKQNFPQNESGHNE